MIEVFDAKRTRSYGCFASFKAATDTLDSLAATGQLGSVPDVSVAAYCSGVLQREYEAVFVGGKWRVPKSPKGGCRKRDLPVGDVGGNGARSTLRRS